jgi:hypothetical protein
MNSEIKAPVDNEIKKDEIIGIKSLTGNPAETIFNPKIIDQLFKKDADGNIIIKAGTIDGTNVYANDFRYKKDTIQYLLGNVKVTDGGWTYSPALGAGGSNLTGTGSNQMSLSIASADNEDAYVLTQGYGMVLGETDTNAVNWNNNPSLEFWARIEIAGTYPTSKVRMGLTPSNVASYAGWAFAVIDGVTRPSVHAYNPGGPEGATVYTIDSVDANKWHKYRIEVTKTSTAHYTIIWYIDEVVVSTQYFTSEWTVTATSFSVEVANNTADAAETATILIAHAIFQQDYS